MKNERPTIELITEKEKLAAGKDATIDVLVRIVPPAVDASSAKRPQLNLSMVLDRSGSMQGRKLDEAKEAAKYCVDQLLASDRISAVIFDDEVDVLFTSQPVENKELLKRAISSVQTDGSTALHEAWVRGGLQVSDHLNGAAINRVLLITDGQANVGETRSDVIVRQAGELKDKGVMTSTIGIGADFNEDLLLPMAEAGGGNGWHVQEPQDMVKIFETELRGLVSQVGHSVTLGIKTCDAVAVADVLNDFEKDAGGGYKLPNLQAGSPLEIVVRIKVPANVADASARLAEFDISYVGTQSQLSEKVTAILEVKFASAEVVTGLAANLHVIKAVTLLMNARARSEAMNRMDRGDYGGAQMALAAAARFTDDVAFSALPNDDQIQMDNFDLRDLEKSLDDRSNDMMSRKRMAYRRESIRKNK
jgi:Ca-activated chloride channel family protein